MLHLRFGSCRFFIFSKQGAFLSQNHPSGAWGLKMRTHLKDEHYISNFTSALLKLRLPGGVTHRAPTLH